jgi:hypothetical protein
MYYVDMLDTRGKPMYINRFREIASRVGWTDRAGVSHHCPGPRATPTESPNDTATTVWLSFFVSLVKEGSGKKERTLNNSDSVTVR